jgi:hypothetical protein
MCVCVWVCVCVCGGVGVGGCVSDFVCVCVCVCVCVSVCVLYATARHYTYIPVTSMPDTTTIWKEVRPTYTAQLSHPVRKAVKNAATESIPGISICVCMCECVLYVVWRDIDLVGARCWSSLRAVADSC